MDLGVRANSMKNVWVHPAKQKKEKDAKLTRPYLFIDGFNIFIRHFVVNEAISSKSEPIGGLVGFIRTLHHLNETLSPAKIFVVWETGGASPRRKSICSEYKSKRAKVKEFLEADPSSMDMKQVHAMDENSKVSQLAMLSKLLKSTPVCQVFVANTEADDIISYLVKEKFAHDPSTKIIVSNDHDYYQLLDKPNVRIYDPAKKNFITKDTVIAKTNIHPRNFALAKAIVGDPSDNIAGIKGIGYKTLSKRFTGFLDPEKDLMVEDVIRQAELFAASKKKIKAYSEVKENESTIRKNWKLIYLNSSTLAGNQIEKINYIVDNHNPIANKLQLIKTIRSNGISFSFDFDKFLTALQHNLTYK